MVDGPVGGDVDSLAQVGDRFIVPPEEKERGPQVVAGMGEPAVQLQRALERPEHLIAVLVGRRPGRFAVGEHAQAGRIELVHADVEVGVRVSGVHLGGACRGSRRGTEILRLPALQSLLVSDVGEELQREAVRRLRAGSLLERLCGRLQVALDEGLLAGLHVVFVGAGRRRHVRQRHPGHHAHPCQPAVTVPHHRGIPPGATSKRREGSRPAMHGALPFPSFDMPRVTFVSRTP